LTREAMGISEEEEIATSSILSPTSEGDDSQAFAQEATIDEMPQQESWWEPDVTVDDLLGTEEEIGLEGLNDLADDLGEEESDDLDVSFLDDVLDDN